MELVGIALKLDPLTCRTADEGLMGFLWSSIHEVHLSKLSREGERRAGG